jgi:phage shock protein C
MPSMVQLGRHLGLNLDAAAYVSLFEPMYCTNCGQQLREESNFCSQCGKSAKPQAASQAVGERLVRIREGKKIAGVCTGFARYLGVDVTLVRVVWLVTALTAGVGFIAYLVAWIAMPLVDLPVPAQAELPPDGQANTLAKI